jgi:nucleoside-diphosphate-sugar epimerase
MEKCTILILGFRSFAASGLGEHLIDAEFEVDYFSRGEEKSNNQVITGDVYDICSNRYFRQQYDYVINFIIIKDGDIDENLRFIKVLCNFCQQKIVKRLYQISSTSVYPNHLNYVNETTEIESDPKIKGAYASIKIAVDQYLLNLKNSSFAVSYLRPGFIVSDNVSTSFAGISIKLPLNLCFLLGDKSSTLPLVDRAKMHEAIVKILQSKNNELVYLLLENKQSTKYLYLKRRSGRRIFTLPKSITIKLARLLLFISIIDKSQFRRIQGLFKSTQFDSTVTEHSLNIKF